MNLLLLLLISQPATANDPKEEPKIVYKQTTEIDFEGLDITGEMIKPTGALVQSRQSAKFNPLIQIRTDFNPEMSQSVNNIK